MAIKIAWRAYDMVFHVQAADLEHSAFEAPSGTPIVDVDFTSLALKEDVAHSHKLFRLAECITAIIICDEVKRAIE